MDQQECFAYTSDACRSGCGTVHRLAGKVINIHIFAELSMAQQDAVIGSIAARLK